MPLSPGHARHLAKLMAAQELIVQACVWLPGGEWMWIRIKSFYRTCAAYIPTASKWAIGRRGQYNITITLAAMGQPGERWSLFPASPRRHNGAKSDGFRKGELPLRVMESRGVVVRHWRGRKPSVW
ncbi:hypothetical protein EYF80_028119 [Liparis tanakae]|uniref:Uncharacterized protein n=1 Tax=Liparis tanakae TaxID=230148 RepID=A0A4Z2H7B2_9TELE|nr:hypothetical protein EYF80_028119 [Liparis tanakae]